MIYQRNLQYTCNAGNGHLPIQFLDENASPRKASLWRTMHQPIRCKLSVYLTAPVIDVENKGTIPLHAYSTCARLESTRPLL